MRALLLITIFSFFWSNVSIAKTTVLSCELTKFFITKNLLSDSTQIPLSKVAPVYLGKKTLILDFDKIEFIDSTVLTGGDYSEIRFLNQEVYFIGHQRNYFKYNAVLNRYTGELKHTVVPSDETVKKKPEELGFKQQTFYNCQKTEKKF